MESSLFRKFNYKPVFFRTASQRLELALTLTLLLLLVMPGQLWYVRIAITIFGIFGIVFEQWRRNGLFWLIIFTLLFFECFQLWHMQDNHKYLISYWCLALGVSLSSGFPIRFLRSNGRILIGLCFLFAVIAKVASPSYMDGSFFSNTLMFDPRFRSLAEKIVGSDSEIFRHNINAISTMSNQEFAEIEEIELLSNPNLSSIAWLMTIWTILIEVIIAFSFLIPMRWRLSSIRNYLLAGFILTTYAVANVVGFGWILAILGIVQLRYFEKNFAMVYFLLVVTLHVYKVPWSTLIG